jgi:hypothetical protein
MDKMAVLTMPLVLPPGPDWQVDHCHRQRVIRGFGVWLRDAPQVTARKGKMTHDHRSVWMQFQVERDQNWYSLYFPGTFPSAATFWMRDGKKWKLLEMFALGEYESGKELAEAVMAFLDSDEADVIHRWRDGEYTEVARCN